MASRKECPKCGALAPAEASTCALCGRSVDGLPVFSTGNADSHLGYDNVYHAGTSATALPWGLDSGGVIAVVLGVAFILGYPLLLRAWEAQVPGTVSADLLLGLCWLAPEVYLLSGAVKAAQMANRSRRFVRGLVVPGLSIASQLFAAALVLALIPQPPIAVTVFGLHGSALTIRVPLALFAAGSVLAAALGRAMPAVVPGKFQRLVAPQLGCLSILAVALLLPAWGGLALMRKAIDIGMQPLWIDIAMIFIISFFGLYWFWPTD